MPLWRSWRLGARDTLNYLHNTDELFLFYAGKNARAAGVCPWEFKVGVNLEMIGFLFVRNNVRN
jgi:hypothetical protein